jgi:hypothetical protein
MKKLNSFHNSVKIYTLKKKKKEIQTINLLKI